MTLEVVTGRGLCIGNIPKDKEGICIKNTITQESGYLIPPNGTKWICTRTGLTPCVSLAVFDRSADLCVAVVIFPRIYIHTDEEITLYKENQWHHTKREPISTITIATLVSLGLIGAGTGTAALISSKAEINTMRQVIDDDLLRIEKSISALESSLTSLSEVVLQNRRGLDLLFLQQGGLCVALREECCFYADHTGVVRDSMAELRKRLKERKREREKNQNWYESWFSYTPWLTTLISTIAGPLILLLLALIIRPCIFNRIVGIIAEQVKKII
ncbi:MLV-related proviral Env polyprotein-like [Colius striatus]|uniref:MLV-related proviral Env polyprotein-like n=1 Tax=Colius striatus TaxID=57412 RepID=UPI002B1D3E69|nr:MLV-related proviral Env polyprotein-like [Colius striatus]